MPELPEVETVKTAIADAMMGHKITHVSTSGKKMRWPIPEDIHSQLVQGQIQTLKRRGKYILVNIVKSELRKTMIIHLGMSGSIRIYDKNQTIEPQKHDHMIMNTKSGEIEKTLVLNDPRRFGGVDINMTENVEKHPLLAKMGVEPLGNGLNAVDIKDAFSGKTTPIKTALLDQSIIAGIGNIYASEALYRSGISPKRLAKNLSIKKIEDLIVAIKSVLNDAIAQGGTSLRDHVQPGGEIGYFVQSLDVYGRTNQPCRTCDAPIKEIKQTGRASFYCSMCQR